MSFKGESIGIFHPQQNLKFYKTANITGNKILNFEPKVNENSLRKQQKKQQKGKKNV